MQMLDDLRSRYKVCQHTGMILWNSGDVACIKMKSGYRRLSCFGKRFAAHRVAWLLHYGHWPEHEIDHINGDKSDNRIDNLRDVPHQLNVQNLRASTSSSSTGILGVGPKNGKWRARILKQGKTHYLGTFDTKEEAQNAYVAAKRKHHEGCTI